MNGERPAWATELDITTPLADLEVPPEIELVRVSVRAEDTALGTVELPACDGRVPAAVLADAVAADCAWSILGLFFERKAGLDRTDLDRCGWTFFLREVWGRPDWPEAWFYEPPALPEPAPLRRVSRSWTPLEVSAPLPDLEGTGPELEVALMVGGVALGRVTVPVPIRSAELRVRLMAAAGFELCRAAVREGIIGWPLHGPPLRERLAIAALRARAVPAPRLRPPSADIAFAPGWRRAVHRALDGAAGWVIGRRESGEIGSAASRRGVLPADAAGEAAAGRVPVVHVPGPGPLRIAYAPDLLWTAPSRVRSSEPRSPGDADRYGRHHFEALFARGADPWRYTTPYEATKYEQTLELIPPGPIARALEIGCAEGHFTERLAARVESLVAADISEIALRRAAERCRGCRNVELRRLDLARDPLPGRFGLIVCSETLYFLGSREGLAAAARRMADALEPDGHLVMAHANVVADDADRPGFDWDVPYGARTIGEIFARTPGLRFVRELRSPLYRVQLFRREEGFAADSAEAETVEEVWNAPPEPAVAEHILWNGGQPVHKTTETTTDRLPILLYHRIAPEGSPGTARYRVTPEAFEEQLRYLRDAGFRGVGLDEWADAMAARRALPGRAVAFTFDDGYQDFQTWAWPALRRHGFTATVFLVAERIGGMNEWDSAYGETLPLLGWEEIRRLQEEGAAFGSHGCLHRALSTLPNVEVARALARSRRILEEGLGAPVTTIAYPWGLSDGAVRHFAAACGYLVGLDSKGGRSPLYGNPLNLSRIEVEGSDGLEAFVAKLGV